MIPVFAIPLGRGRYRDDLRARRRAAGRATRPRPIREFTQRCTDVLEMYVRRYPTLWLWMHRRWRDEGSGPPRGMFPAGQPDAEAVEDRVLE